MMVGSNLKDTQLQQVVDKTMRSVDCDQDGKMDNMLPLVLMMSMNQQPGAPQSNMMPLLMMTMMKDGGNSDMMLPMMMMMSPGGMDPNMMMVMMLMMDNKNDNKKP